MGVKVSIIAGVAIIAVGKLGITITPFVAAIGAMSLGAGLALTRFIVKFWCWYFYYCNTTFCCR